MTRKYIIVADDSLKGFDEGIEDLERKWGAEEIEPCEDCISRTELLSRIDAERKYLLNFKMDGAEHIIVHHARRIIEDMPNVTPQPKMGRWIIGTDTGSDMYECSSCECRMIKKWYDLAVGRKGYQYCPYCGSRMEVAE